MAYVSKVLSYKILQKKKYIQVNPIVKDFFFFVSSTGWILVGLALLVKYSFFDDFRISFLCSLLNPIVND